MSTNRKRSRKSKLEVRSDVDVDETENSILQAKSKLQIMLPKLLQKTVMSDHTYSLQHASPKTQQPPPPIQLSVKVEVEEFDESLINADSKNTVDSRVMTPVSSIDTTFRTRGRARPVLRVFNVNLEKVYKISEHIIWSSSNVADKFLSMELKNIWGRSLRPTDDQDPYNELIQEALHSWGAKLVSVRKAVESPLFYQCHICELAWWYLGPFRDHIRIHDHRTLKVYHQQNYSKAVIVATDTFRNVEKYIPCEGNCYRCGSDYDFHVKADKELYSCTKCMTALSTCYSLQQHMAVCFANQTTFPNIHICRLCYTNFTEAELVDSHMVASHLVRSDIPIPFAYKTCAICNKRYHTHNTHACVKNSLNSTCKHCYRKFFTKTLASIHMVITKNDYKCKICNRTLVRSCMETQHMLTHSQNYRMVYKCISSLCSPMMLFPDEKSVKIHRTIYHKQKFDKRRIFFEQVLIPEQCVKPEFVLDMDHIADCKLATKVILGELPPDTKIAANTQTDVQKDKEIVLEDIQIKEELVTFKDNENSCDSPDCEMDYEQMLSKVFKMSDTEEIPKKKIKVSNDRVVSDTEKTLSNVFKVSDGIRNVDKHNDSAYTEIQIKTEAEEISFEELIDIQDDPITIKQEPVDTTFDYDQVDSICNIEETSRIVEFPDFLQCNIKTESEERDVDRKNDSNVTAVKIEPVNVKKELVEATDIKIIESYTEQENATIKTTPTNQKKSPVKKIKKKKAKKKVLKKNSSVLMKNQTKQNIRKITKNNSKKEVLQTTSEFKLPQSTNSDVPPTKPVETNVPSKTRVTRAKAEAKVMKTQRTYTCTKCGYANNHRLYRIHVDSKCELSPLVEEDNSYMCTKCDTSFSTLKSYLVHFQQHGYALLHCPSCNMKFEGLKELLPHFHKHIRYNFVNCWMISTKMEPTKKQHRCQTCREIVQPENFFTHWEAHLKLISNVKIEPAPLENGTENFNSNTKALPPTVLHIALQQLRTITRDKECLVCHRNFSRRHDCKRHIIEHLLLDAYMKKENTPDNTFRCQICLEGFSQMDKYKFHMREHGALPVYRCELCNKTFSDSSNFAKHKKLHSLKLLTCDICLKKFHAKVSLERHMMMHQVTEPIKCALCSKLFYTMSHYNKHMKVRHYRATKFKCILCDISFDTLRKKWDHGWAVHKERKHKADCPICHMGFRKFLDVKTHALIAHDVELKFYNIRSDFRVSTIKMKTVCKMKKVPKTRLTETLVIPSDLVDNQQASQ